MELKEFVKKVIIDLDQALTEANNETKREVRFKGVKEHRTALEFDVAVTVESTDSTKAGGEIKVWGIAQVGGSGSAELKNSTVSRVNFGVDIGERTKEENAIEDTRRQQIYNSNRASNNSSR